MRRKIGLVLVILLVCMIPLGIGHVVRNGQTRDMTIQASNYLFLGVDAVGVNTDVMLLAGYDPAEREIAVMQLPRDMYCDVDGQARRINQLYANHLQDHDPKEALTATAAYIGDSLGIKVDGAVAFDLQFFVKLVDAMGGVWVDVPFEMKYQDEAQDLHIDLPKGSVLLDGKMAEQFVRFRSSYLEGDIGRLDAQKIFLSAFIEKIKKEVPIKEILFLLSDKENHIIFTADRKTVTNLLLNGMRNASGITGAFLSIPGEAIYLADMGWCYAMNREATWQVVNQYFSTDYIPMEKIDGNGRFCARDTAFANIYHARQYEFEIYTTENIQNIKITKKD